MNIETKKMKARPVNQFNFVIANKKHTSDVGFRLSRRKSNCKAVLRTALDGWDNAK